ncbi:MAG: polysaccharide deacetylase family protein [Lachnospiraceae bacterium]|nr:polysaccharide deacetylase family protein [Lachnospiraceae bacterium]
MAQNEAEQLQKSRRKRVERLKKIIVTVVLATILIPTAVSIFLGIRLAITVNRLEAAKAEQAQMQDRLDELEAELDSLKESIALQTREDAKEDDTVLESENSGQDVMTQDGIKRVYLTFDDGPSANTAAILDLLAEYQVKATFFVVGDTSEEGKQLYQRIVSEGHSIGIHSYSHKYGEIYASEEAFFEDFYLLSDYLYDVTGVRPDICRLPGGSSNTVSHIDMSNVVNELNAQGISCYDWNISGGDADGHDLTAEEIAENVLTGVDRFQTSIVLLHDGKDKSVTVEALRMILEKLSTEEQLEIKPITEETPIILHIKH